MNGQIQTVPKEYVISEEESERMRILKIWFTVMVVFIHSYAEEVQFTEGTLVLDVPVWLVRIKYLLSQVIARCAVPGFFLLSGILLYRRGFTWAGNLRKKGRTLLVPYLLINTAWIVIFLIAQHISAFRVFFSRADNIVADWSPVGWANAYIGFSTDVNGGHYPFVYPLWFIRDLMVLNVLAPLLKTFIDRFPRLVLLAMVTAMVFDANIHIPVLRRDSLVFFSLGYYMVKYNVHMTDTDRLDPALLTGAYGISVALDCVMLDSPWQHLARMFSILLGIAFFFRFTTAVKNPAWKNRLLALAGYTLPVYLLHEMNLSVLKKLLRRLLPMNVFFQVLEYFGIPAVIICLCIAGSWMLRRFTPRLYALLTGGRTL